ncbi:hypothetical protein CYMTET_19825 [Cymbomonas tetramitiformis]|uniref:Uncharacterized protein n=1 Tax=Cymbomonas tetramitiformis TaxID=36881 RepID=A0AAE0L4U4_9CHLO|nr:hypothetical protein CYMTET_19825 [Cymbomonas tetramitiformis]
MGTGASKSGKTTAEKSQATKDLEERLTENRPSVAYGDVNKVMATLSGQTDDIATCLEEEFFQTTSYTKAELKAYNDQLKKISYAKPGAKVIKPKGPAKPLKGKDKLEEKHTKNSIWRQKVAKAKTNARQTISVLQCLKAKFETSGEYQFLGRLPFYVLEALGDREECAKFLENYQQLENRLANKPVMEPVTAKSIKRMAENRSVGKLRSSRLTKSTSSKDPPKTSQKTITGAKGARTDIVDEAEALMLEEAEAETEKQRLAEAEAKARLLHDEEMAKHLDVLRKEAEVLQTMLNFINDKSMPKLPWRTPDVGDPATLVTLGWKETEAEMVNYFRSGSICVQILAAGSTFTMPDGSTIPLWTAEIYKLAESCLGKYASDHIMEMKSKDSEMKGETGTIIEGLTMGGRQMLAIVMAVSKLCGGKALGDAAVKKLKIIVHCSSELEQQVVSNIRDRNYFGLTPENIIIVFQSRLPGFKYDENADGNSEFMEDKESPLRMYGTGFAYQQLAWEGAAYVLTSENSKQVLSESVLAYLQAEKVEWLLSNRLNDMHRLHPDFAIDTESIRYALKMRELVGANMCIAVKETEGLTDAIDHGCIVFSQYDQGVPFVDELVTDELLSGDMQAVARDVSASNSNKVWTGCDRYVFHLPSLHKTMLAERFTPLLRLKEFKEMDKFAVTPEKEKEDIIEETEAKTEIEKEGKSDRFISNAESAGMSNKKVGFGSTVAVYPFFHMSEITRANKIRCVAARTAAPDVLELKNADSLNAALEVVYRQDSVMDLHRALDELCTGSRSRVTFRSTGAKPRFNVLVFCAFDENNASQQAANALLPLFVSGVDKVHLVSLSLSNVRSSRQSAGMALSQFGLPVWYTFYKTSR